ncbi:MAG TPA: peroxiredoxin [Actinomycetota bacterium]|nr:peroxiredoxin [Actinomycetota bacterium]
MLKEGDKAPDFEMKDADGKTWRLSDLRGQKVVLYFYPADDTPGCTTQACDFRDRQETFTGSGYTVLGVSPQGAESHQRFSDKFGLNFPLLIDEDAAVAREYGAYRGDGAMWQGIPLRIKRSTFLIDAEGNIEKALYGVRAKGHADELLESIGVTA